MPARTQNRPDQSSTPKPATANVVTSDMTLDFDGLMGILANSLYHEKKVFIRELVQNAHDGVLRRKQLEPDHHGRVDIDTRPDEDWISFADNGLGMSEEDLHVYLSRIGASGTESQGRESEQVSSLVGRFGIGFLSGFIVARTVEVRTRKLGEDAGWLWRNDGGKSYTLEPCEVRSPGTTVKVLLKDPTDRVLLEAENVTAVVREYCDMLRVPIHVNHSTVSVNTQDMPWERDGISDEDREIDCKIYLARTIRGDSLIETFPVRLDEGEVRASGILYVSRMRTFGVRVPRNVRIYQDRMFVANDADLLPPWAEFVSGIIVADSLTPNAARDGFVRNQAWGRLRDALGDRILDSLARLQHTNRKQFSFILRYHNLGVKAACHHHEPFFRRFAHLLEWRVNRLPDETTSDDDRDAFDPDMPGAGLSFHWRTLPEVLDATPGEEHRPKRLLTFTTANAANQYFDMANAEGVRVVDASYPFEDDLIAAYVKLPDAPPIELVYVDRQGGGLFKDLRGGDEQVRSLAATMSNVIMPGGGGRLKVEARRFQPPTLPAVMLNVEASKAEHEARRILGDPGAPGNLRDLAEELLRNSRAGNAMRMTINAGCAFIRELAAAPSESPEVLALMRGVYNSTFLYNSEMMTPHNARVLHDQFGIFMADSLKMIAERANLEREQEAIREERRRMQPEEEEAREGHFIVFLMTPFSKNYDKLESALREVVERRWACQLCLARDRALDAELRGSIEKFMRQARAFIAEVSVGNPNVMYELGRAHALYSTKPVILLAHPRDDKGKVELPADLAGLLRVDYSLEADEAALAEHLNRELRKSQALAGLLDEIREMFVPAAKLREWCSTVKLSDTALQALVDKIPTVSAWRRADAKAVHQVVDGFDLDEDDAGLIVRKVRKGLEAS